MRSDRPNRSDKTLQKVIGIVLLIAPTFFFKDAFDQGLHYSQTYSHSSDNCEDPAPSRGRKYRLCFIWTEIQFGKNCYNAPLDGAGVAPNFVLSKWQPYWLLFPNSLLFQETLKHSKICWNINLRKNFKHKCQKI